MTLERERRLRKVVEPGTVAEYETPDGRFFVFACYRDSLRRNGGSVRIRRAWDVKDMQTDERWNVESLAEARADIAERYARPAATADPKDTP